MHYRLLLPGQSSEDQYARSTTVLQKLSTVTPTTVVVRTSSLFCRDTYKPSLVHASSRRFSSSKKPIHFNGTIFCCVSKTLRHTKACRTSSTLDPNYSCLAHRRCVRRCSPTHHYLRAELGVLNFLLKITLIPWHVNGPPTQKQLLLKSGQPHSLKITLRFRDPVQTSHFLRAMNS